jgi:trans-2,3-dihydro-3-hydroxyanthranilate isomerase
MKEEPMRNYRLFQLDVFTDQALAGNSLAVFPEAEGLSDEEMLKIAREMNLSETVFVLPPTDDKALRRLRIYTPTREIPFAGHPVVGTWNLLAREGVVPSPEDGNGWARIHQEIGIGVLPVDLEFADGEIVQVVMTQGKFEIVDEIDDRHDQAELARVIGHDTDAIDETLPIQIISTGLPFLAVPMRSLSDLRRCKVNGSALAEVYTRLGATGCLVFTRETIEVGAARAHARMFAPADNIPEDPATGSACGSLGGYLIHHHAISVEPQDGVSRFIIEQGDFINRPSRLNLEVRGGIGKVEEVRVGGPSVVVMRGELVL